MPMKIQQEKGKIFAPLKNKWLVETPEEIVRQLFIVKLVNVYGYDIKQMEQEISVNNSSRGQGQARADIVVWKSEKDKLDGKSAFIVVECKAEKVKIREEDYFQGYNYASWAGAAFFVTTNEKETRFFNVQKDFLPKKLEEIIDIPNISQVNDDKEIDKILKATKAFERDEFARLLFKCHNIIRNNDKLSPEAAFDEISKILFMKIRYERNPQEDVIFSKAKFERDQKHYDTNVRPFLKSEDKDIPYIQILFRQTKKEFEEDQLFEENDTIKIKQISFEQIVEALQKYNLSDTSDDVKGIAFEEFLGKTFRGELGQFFTPRTIVDFMVEVLDPNEDELICDPCAGSGGFLIRTFEYLREKIEKEIQHEKEVLKARFFDKRFSSVADGGPESINKKVNKLLNQLNQEIAINNPKGRLHKLSHNCIFGTDANPRMARTSKMNMIMHGDGHGGVHHHDGLLNVNGIFENRFDIILTNPPFGARVDKSMKISENDIFNDSKKIEKYIERFGSDYTNALKQVNDNIGKSLIDLFDLGKVSGLTEVLFMERCLRLLKPGGRMGIVLPEGVLNNQNLQKVREYFEDRAKIVLITSIPQDVFVASGATVKPSIVFFKKFTNEESAKFALIKKESEKEINNKYVFEIERIKKEQLPKKEINKKIKEIEANKIEEIRKLIKEKFDYEIPIAKVEKAGITTTGAKCENELEDLAKEFTKYRKDNTLWDSKTEKFSYELKTNKLVRINCVGEEEVFYGE